MNAIANVLAINGHEYLDVTELAYNKAFGKNESVEGDPKRKRESSRFRPSVITARELGETEFPPIRFIVPGFLPEGATILAGRPKLGKSWLALDIALAAVDRGGQPLRLFRTPLEWLQADCQGAVPLKSGAGYWLRKCGGPFIVDDFDHATQIQALLGADAHMHRILLARSDFRRAA